MSMVAGGPGPTETHNRDKGPRPVSFSPGEKDKGRGPVSFRGGKKTPDEVLCPCSVPGAATLFMVYLT